jgi:hypothetical protein
MREKNEVHNKYFFNKFNNKYLFLIIGILILILLIKGYTNNEQLTQKNALSLTGFIFKSSVLSSNLNQQPGIEGKDAWIESSAPNRNYGASITIDINAVDTQRALIEFNLSGVIPTANIQNARSEERRVGKECDR